MGKSYRYSTSCTLVILFPAIIKRNCIVYNCAFIGSEDTGRLYANESFEVLGRLDDSEAKGCSLLVV